MDSVATTNLVDREAGHQEQEQGESMD